MEHTYLRYECADSFGLVVASSSSKAPPSNSILGFLEAAIPGRTAPLLLATAGSYCVGYNVRTSVPVLQLGHREHLNGGVGTGRALNSDEVVCLDTVFLQGVDASYRIATGWVDGAVRIFTVTQDEAIRASSSPKGMAHTLLKDDDEDDEFSQREPLVLNGHNQSPVRTVAFDKYDPLTSSRLASGASDGSVVLWDVVAETGMFRLLGHRGGVTEIKFLHLDTLDYLITTCLDGLVKIWDLEGQCCVQTIANHRGEVWSADLACLANHQQEDSNRWRLVTGGNDGQVRVWSAEAPKRSKGKDLTESENEAPADGKNGILDDVCHFLGFLSPPPNVPTSSEKISSIHFHPAGRFAGVLRAGSKTVDVYLVRNTQEAMKKRQRRLKRREEKKKKKDHGDHRTTSGQKRGILDDPESVDDAVAAGDADGVREEELVDPEQVKASDEFEYLLTVRADHKIRDFIFVSQKEKGELTRIVFALATNSFETFSLVRKKLDDGKTAVVVAEKAVIMDLEGHPTGIRAVALSSDDKLACTVSKNVTKIWNVSSRSCIQSLSPAPLSHNKDTSACYGLCACFLPGNTHVVVGTREGHLLILDINAGEVVYSEEKAHNGAVWSIDVRKSTTADSSIAFVTGSADKAVKFWDIESAEDDSGPVIVHTRTLQMTDDVVAVRYSYSVEASRRMVFVSTLDCTIKVFFDDSLKLFLSLYGHKLPALAVDSSDDDTILASSGADKAVKIWGLDFGDTHRTLHGHEDSITDLRFVKRTHNFFTASKDGSVRYWDGDRFEQILLLTGHFAEINSLAVSRTGAFVLSGGMDRQVRVWERTKDIVFISEEKERQLEKVFDRVNTREEGGTEQILGKATENSDDEMDHEAEPQSEAAVKKSALSVAAGDRLLEGLERADQELKDMAQFRNTHGPDKERPPNPLLLNMHPAHYVLWILKSIKSAELEQSLLVLPLSHLERLMYYCTVLLRQGRGVEVCSRVTVFILKVHQHQIVTHRSIVVLLRELRRLVRLRLAESRDIVGYNLAAMRLISQAAQEKKQLQLHIDAQPKDIWAGLGLGSDVAAVLDGRAKRRKPA